MVDPVKDLITAIKAKNWEDIVLKVEEIIVDMSTIM